MDSSSKWQIGDTCIMIVSVPKRYTQEFEVKDFDGKYYTLKRGNSIHHASPTRMFQTKEEALEALDTGKYQQKRQYRNKNALTGGERTEKKSMNRFEAEQRFAQRMKDNYPPGTRIMLLSMVDDPRPVEDNTRGTVKVVDDIGTLHCDFDNGRSLGIVPGEDSFRRMTDEELAEERMAKLPHIDVKLTAFSAGVGKSFMGYSTEHRWNGWECPLFPKASADEILQSYNNENGSMKYDEETDRYIADNPQYDCSEQYEGQDYVVNGKIERLYAIGSHEWCWDNAGPEENQGIDEEEDNSPVMGM